MKFDVLMKHIALKNGATNTIKKEDTLIEEDDKQPNLFSNTIEMRDLVRIHSDKLNLTHIRYLLSLNDNDWKKNFTKKYSAKETKEWLKQYRNLLKTILEDGYDEIEREYTIRKNNRLYADGGIQTLERNIRNFIQDDDIKDYDMINAQPSILLYLTKKANLPHTNLQYYCDNRTEILKGNKEKYKSAVNYSLFCDKPKPTGNLNIDGMIQEYLDNRSLLIHLNKQYINPEKEENTDNPKGSDMSNILCYWECVILNSVVSRYKDGINTLLFDGFYSHLDIPIEELNAMTTEYGIKWAVKPLETRYQLPDDFDHTEYLTYEEKKREFENEVCLVTFAGNFKVCDEIDGTWKMMTERDVRIKYKNWRETNANGDDIDFLDKWLKDKNRVDYNRMVFHPYTLPKYDICHPKEFNTFKGFKTKKLDREVKDEEVEWFKTHLRNCFGWETEDNIGEQVVNFLIRYMARILQKPHIKIEGILVLRGMEGTGKDTLKVFFHRMLGDDYIYEGHGMDGVLEKGDGGFTDYLITKLVCVMNEAAAGDGIKNMEQLKHKSTSKVLNVREKYAKHEQMKDLNNMIVNSNNLCPVQISSTDRRYMLVKTNEDLHGMNDYWNNLYANLDNEQVMTILFTWLLQQDIEDFNWETQRVVTPSFKRLATKSISEVYLVLYHSLKEDWDGEGVWKMKSSELNARCIYLNQHILERNFKIKKGTIKERMEELAPRYVSCERIKDKKSSACNTWVCKEPQKLLDRLIKLEFKYFDPNTIDLDALNDFKDFQDE